MALEDPPGVKSDGASPRSRGGRLPWAKLRSLARRAGRFRRARWAVADQSAISLGNFVSVYLLASTLPLAEFGVFTLLFTGLTMAAGFQNATLSQPHNVLGTKLDADGYRAYTGTLALFQLAGSAVVASLLILVGVVMAASGTPFGWTLAVLGVATMPWLTQEFVRRTFYTRSHTRAAFVNNAVCYGLQMAGIGLLVIGDAVTLRAALLVLGGSSLVASILGAIQLRTYLSGDRANYGRERLRAAWGRTWNFGRWLTARSVLEWFGTHGHTWLLALLLGVESLGLYRAAYHLVNVLNPLTMAVQAYVPSRAGHVLAADGPRALGRWLSRNFLIAGGLYTIVVLLVIGFSGQLLTLFYGDRFSEFGALLEWVIVLSAIEKLVRKFRLFPGTLVLVLERTRSLFFLDLVAITLLLGGGVLLIDAFGILGAPLVKLIVAALMLGVLWAYARSILAEADAPAAKADA